MGLNLGDEKDMEQNGNGFHSYEELEPMAKRQRKDTDAKYSKEGKGKEGRRKQQTDVS